jgi:tetratricopeptide (TPR) repeat protein
MALARTAAEREDPLPLAEALLRCARDSDAPEWEEAARLAVGLREKAWPPGHPRAGYAAMALADLLRRDGRLGEAEAVLRRCERLAEASARGGDSDPLRDAVFARGRLHLAQGQDEEAEAVFLRVIEIEEAGRHPKRPPFTLPMAELRVLYSRQGRHLEAAAMAEREQTAHGPGRLSPRDEAILIMERGRALLAAGRAVTAREALSRALDTLSRNAIATPDPLASTIQRLLADASRGP